MPPKSLDIEYDALQPGQISLLSLHPRQGPTAPVRATLYHEEVEFETYETLPYTWGYSMSSGVIYLDDRPVTMKEDILEALQRVRDATEPRMFCNDAIYLNHNDNEEQEEQFSRIANISSNADFVDAFQNEEEFCLGHTAGDERDTTGMTINTPSHSSWVSSWDQPSDVASHTGFTPSPQQYSESMPTLSNGSGSNVASPESSSPDNEADFDLKTSVHELATQSYGSNGQPMGNCGHNDNQLPVDRAQEIVVQPTSSTARKRPLANVLSEDQDMVTQEKKRIAGSSPGETEESNRVLACPFQKFDPHRHQKCLKYTLHRIKDVKQHLYRQHRQPAYYCARCYKIFVAPEDRDEHARSARPCDKQPMPHFEGITDDQRKYLNKSSSRKKSLRDQWFEVWGVLFPKCPPPQSPFIGNYVKEMTPLLRGLWNKRSSEIISSVLKDYKGAEVDGRILKNIMCSVFDRLEADTYRCNSSMEPRNVPETNLYADPARNLCTVDVQPTLAPEFDATSDIGFKNPYEQLAVFSAAPPEITSML